MVRGKGVGVRGWGSGVMVQGYGFGGQKSVVKDLGLGVRVYSKTRACTVRCVEGYLAHKKPPPLP